MSIKKHIPNTITALNAVCGAAGIGAVVLLQRPDLAFCLMLLGAAFDFCDGFAARALGAYSPMGKELDSLADLITFGVLPAVMLSNILARDCGTSFPIAMIPFAITVFSALRLAKFNVDERQTASFIGLPTPACAMICGSSAYMIEAASDSAISAAICTVPVITTASIVLSLLLVCSLPMFSMKIHKGEKLGARRIAFFVLALLCCISAIALKWGWAAIILLSFIGYILINLVAAIVSKNGRRE